MADESTSVGKIQLDVEFSKDSIAKEIKNLNSSINSGIKGSFNGMAGQMNGFVKNTLGKMMNSFKTLGNAGAESNKKVAQSTEEISAKMQQLVNQMESATNRAELHRQKLLELQSQYDRLSKSGLGDSDKAKKLLDKITLAEDKVNRYGAISDRTRLKIEQLDLSMANLGDATNSSSAGFKKAENGAKKAGKSFKDLGNQSAKSTGKVAGFAKTITRSFMQVLKRVFVLQLIYKAIRSLINYMNGALKTNKNFVSSMNQIKTNLKVAFQPIYDFVLPALNALMQAVARVTTYIAAAISSLFGKSYKQSYDSAKGIEKSKKAMDGFGSSAKKAKNTLMGFDEVNQLDIPDDEAGGGTGAHEMEMPDTSTIDMTGLKRFKEVMSDLFKPFKLAWKSEGLKVINAARYLLESIRDLIGVIANSWMEVWTNGTGTTIIQNILGILKDVFSLVGDIANAFKIAWETNDIGTKIIQNIADALNIVLGIFKEMGESLNNVWGQVGQQVVDTFMKALETATGIIKSFGEALKVAWDIGGKHLFESLIILAAKVIEVAGVIWNNFIGPVASWILDILGPAFGRALDFAGAMVDGIIWWLDVLLMGLDLVKEFADKVVGFFQWVYDVLVGHSIIPDLVNEMLAWFSILKIKGEEIWTAIKIFLVNTWESIKISAQVIWEGIRKHIIDPINAAWNSLKEIWSNIKTYILGKWDEIRTGISSKATILVDAIKSPFNTAKDWIGNLIKDAFNWGKNLVSNIIDGIKSMASKVGDAISSIIPSSSSGGGGRSAQQVLNDAKKRIQQKNSGIKNSSNSIPKLARGGIVDQPTLAMVGERGKEAVVPFENSGFLEALSGSIVNALLQIMPLFSGQGSNESNDNKELVLNIEGTPLVRILLPLINNELSRLGYRTLFQAN